MNQGTQGYCLPKKTEGRKSRETVPLNQTSKLFEFHDSYEPFIGLLVTLTL
jgi:hypothetical protein